MEITLEKIELVKDRTGVTYKEAKEALEKANGNVVEAIISIEDAIDDQTSTKKLGAQGEALIGRMKEIVKKGNVSRIMIKREEDTILNIPLNAGVLGAVVAPWGVIAGVIAAFGFKCQIKFVKDNGEVIDLSDKAGDLYEDAKNKGTDLYGKAKDAAPDVFETVKEKGGEAFEFAKDAADKAKDVASDAVDKIKAKKEDVEDFVEDKIDDLKVGKEEEPCCEEAKAEEPCCEEAPAEEPVVEEAPAEEPVVEEAPAEEPSFREEAPAEPAFETVEAAAEDAAEAAAEAVAEPAAEVEAELQEKEEAFRDIFGEKQDEVTQQAEDLFAEAEEKVEEAAAETEEKVNRFKFF